MGSSTFSHFVKVAEQIYSKVRFDISTETESAGGEKAIIEDGTDLAEVERIPTANILGRGVVSTLIGWDANAVIVNERNPVDNLTQSQLKDIFIGKITNWVDLGNPNLTITPYIVTIESATRKVMLDQGTVISTLLYY